MTSRGPGGFPSFLLRLRDRLGLERAIGPFTPLPRPGAPEVTIIYRRPPERVDEHRQEILYDGDGLKVTLLIRTPGAEPIEVDGAVALPGGSALLWFSYPGRWYEVASFHDPEGRLLGWYTNLVRPPRLEGTEWRLDDLFLDVWLPAGGRPRVLDREQLREARDRGWVCEVDAERAERECDRIIRRAERGDWPPPPVADWPLESVPYLRLRRDAPGTYHAALLSGRVIGYGLYLLGAVSLTVLAFGAAQALSGRAPAQVTWVGTLAAEAALLLPLALRGALPATRWPRPVPSDERTFFIGALATGLGVLFLQDAETWREPLAGIYAALGLFCAIFAGCRAWFDRALPVYAGAGLLVCLVALGVLLL